MSRKREPGGPQFPPRPERNAFPDDFQFRLAMEHFTGECRRIRRAWNLAHATLTPKEQEAARRHKAMYRRVKQQIYIRLRWATDENYRMRKTAYQRAWQRANADRVRAYTRKSFRKHREDRLMYNKWYHREHQVEINLRHRERRRANREYELLRDREYNRAHRDQRTTQSREYRQRHPEKRREYYERRRFRRNPNYRGRENIYASARNLEQQVIELRTEGWTWREVAELTGRSINTCQCAYYRAMKRQQEQEGAA